jgi:sulfatase maturation enzyme AslB (radical SAM superfamily)
MRRKSGAIQHFPDKSQGVNQLPQTYTRAGELDSLNASHTGQLHREGDEASAGMPTNSLPAVCDVSVTNVCNAACDFCGFSHDKKRAGPRRHLDPDEFARALPILRRRHIRYMTFRGGEPLLHPGIVSLVTSATRAGMQCGLITNGWFLSRQPTPTPSPSQHHPQRCPVPSEHIEQSNYGN